VNQAKSTNFYLVETTKESQESLVSGLSDDVGSANESLENELESDDDDYQLYELPTLRGRRERFSRCLGENNCCTSSRPCGIGDGDCDRDSHCRPGLRCGKNNCRGPGFDATDDCCEPDR